MTTSASVSRSAPHHRQRGWVVLGTTCLVAVGLAGCGGSRPVTGDSGATGSGGASATGGGGGTASGSGGASGTGGSNSSGSGGRATGGSTGATGGATSGTGGRATGSGGATTGGSGGGPGPTDGGVDGTTGCTYGGKTYAVGASFPATDGCNTCTCGSSGGVACTKIACVDSGATCALDTSYQFRDDGGFRAYVDVSKLTAPRTHTVSRDHLANALPDVCNREIPCASTTEVDIAELQQALAHADVVAALAMTTKPFYGIDTRPSDGSVLMFDRADGRGFTLGSGNAVPAGLRALEGLLHTLQMQTVASSNCANLR